MLRRTIEWLGEYNPQLYRELQGKLSKRNIFTVILIALIGYISFFISTNLAYRQLSPTLFTDRFCIFEETSISGYQDLQDRGIALDLISDSEYISSNQETTYFVRLNEAKDRNRSLRLNEDIVYLDSEISRRQKELEVLRKGGVSDLRNLRWELYFQESDSLPSTSEGLILSIRNKARSLREEISSSWSPDYTSRDAYLENRIEDLESSIPMSDLSALQTIRRDLYLAGLNLPESEKGLINEIKSLSRESFLTSHAAKIIEIQNWISNNPNCKNVDHKAIFQELGEVLFVILSIGIFFTSITVGIFMLSSDIIKEKRAGTLKFILLSPQPSISIIFGKILGVPFLLYLFIGLATLLQLFCAAMAQISWTSFIAFDLIVIASTLFFYCTALLISTIVPGISTFLPLLLVAAIDIFQYVYTGLAMTSGQVIHYLPTDFFALLCPIIFLAYILPENNINFDSIYEKLDWFGQFYRYSDDPITTLPFIPIAAFTLISYGVALFWILYALRRKLKNGSETALGKKDSYYLTIIFLTYILGFSWQLKQSFPVIFISFSIVESSFLLGLIYGVSPQRQSILDWIRSRKEEFRRNAKANHREKSLIPNLMTEDDSPAFLAVLVNCFIVYFMFSVSCMLILLPADAKIGIEYYLPNSFIQDLAFPLFSCMGWILICTLAIQVLLFRRGKLRALWATISVVVLLIFPSIFLIITQSLLNRFSPLDSIDLFSEISSLGLLSLPWFYPELRLTFAGYIEVSWIGAFSVFFTQFIIVVCLLLIMKRQFQTLK